MRHPTGHLVPDSRRVRRHRHVADQDHAGSEGPRNRRGDRLSQSTSALEGPILDTFEGTPLYALSPPWWVSGLRHIARECPFDLVHAQHYGGATRAYAACRRYGWPMVYEIHSLLGEEVERDRLGRGLVFRAYQALERRVFRHAAAVVTLGEPVRQVVIDEKGVPANRVSVIYPGIDLGEFDRPSETADAVIPGVGPEHKVVMYVGSIVHPNQGVPILVDALPRVFDARPEARCVLVGGPAEAGDAYRRRLGPHGEKLIVLAGRAPNKSWR